MLIMRYIGKTQKMLMVDFGPCVCAEKTHIFLHFTHWLLSFQYKLITFFPNHFLLSLLVHHVLCIFNLFLIVHNEYTWKELVLAAIGEQFGPVLSNDDDICGVTVSLRQYDNIIEVWNANASANVNAVLARIKSIVPNVEFRNPFYKGTFIIYIYFLFYLSFHLHPFSLPLLYHVFVEANLNDPAHREHTAFNAAKTHAASKK